MIAAGYFLAFAAAGLNVPLATAALLQAGFAASLIGAVFSLRSALQALATPLWAAIADAHGSARLMAVRGQLGVALGMVILAFAHTPGLLVLGYFVFGFLGGGSTTLIDALNIVTHPRERYGNVRLWGTLGYAALIVVTGQLPALTQRVVFGAAAVFSLLSAFALLQTKPVIAERRKLRLETAVLKNKTFVAVVAVATLQWAAHCAFTIFMLPLGTARGVPQHIIAWTIVLGLLIEVVAMRYSGRLYSRFGAKQLLLFSTLTGVLRWLGLYTTTGTASFVLLHGLHGITFGMFYPTIVTAVAHVAPQGQRVTAQALLTSVGFGLGGALGASLAGFTYQHIGLPETWAAMLLPAGAATLLVVFSSGINALCRDPKSA